MGVQCAVGELDTVERHRLAHPVGPSGWRVRVDVDTVRQAGLCLATGLPAPALPAVTSPVHWYHVQKEQVAGLRVQAGHRHSAGREHAPGEERCLELPAGQGWAQR